LIAHNLLLAKLYINKKIVKAEIAERTISLLPAKDIMVGKKVAIVALKRKKTPAVINPAKPILPDLYQTKLLYRESIKLKMKIKPKITIAKRGTYWA
jgi:hypothetical protein